MKDVSKKNVNLRIPDYDIKTWIAIGLSFGLMFGMLVKNLVIGMGIGLLLGISIGFSQQKSSK